MSEAVKTPERKRKKKSAAPYIFSGLGIAAAAKTVHTPFLKYPGYAAAGFLIGFGIGRMFENMLEV